MYGAWKDCAASSVLPWKSRCEQELPCLGDPSNASAPFETTGQFGGHWVPVAPIETYRGCWNLGGLLYTEASYLAADGTKQLHAVGLITPLLIEMICITQRVQNNHGLESLIPY